MAQTRIMSPEQVRRTLRRFAYEIIERNRGMESTVLFGIRESGVPLAHAVAEEMSAVSNGTVRARALNVTPFRDDRPGLDPPATPPHNLDVADRNVILIDDVIFTGRTARAALDAVLQYGRPRSIQLVVLIDRGHREYPIQPDCTGRRLQTKREERVVVEGDEEFAVSVQRGDASSVPSQSNRSDVS
jgi:pyrimidine operon attenuation protein/uracil phosphoribosyltransferase